METSPAKRRKLSAEPSDDSNVPSTKTSLPAPREAIKSSIDRPSIASPTKAIVARHNPELLAKIASAGLANPIVSGRENESERTPTDSLPLDQSSARNAEERSQNPAANVAESERLLEGKLPASVQPPSLEQSVQSNGDGLSAPPRRRSRTPGRGISRVSDTAHVQKSADLGQVKQPAPQTQAEPPVPVVKPGGTDSSNSTKIRESEALPEPELPLTPTQRGIPDPVVTTPAPGIHNTPNKRPKREKGTRLRQSALKLQKGSVTGPEAPKVGSELDATVQLREPLKNASRYLIPIDQHAEKQQIRDQLLQELEELQADITLAEKETERHRRNHFSGKGPVEASNPDDIAKLVGRTLNELSLEGRPPNHPSIFNSVSSFLPFARRPRRPPTEPPKESAVPSHLPVAVDDQLPYLQAFTPLRLDSVVTILPTKSSAANSPPAPLLQHHDISLTAPSGLFSARINMTVDTQRLSITSLSLVSLDTNAESEFGHWARQRASGKGFLGRDVNAICWAMARWYEFAIKRARFWCLVEREFGDEDGRRRAAERLRALPRRKRKRKRAETIEEREEDGVENEEEHGEGERKWTRRELLPRMKRTSFDLRNESVHLTIEWHIIFDWTGEAENAISATARLPKSWQEADERRSLAKVPETFDRLLKARGPIAAVRAVVALLMPS